MKQIINSFLLVALIGNQYLSGTLSQFTTGECSENLYCYNIDNNHWLSVSKNLDYLLGKEIMIPLGEYTMSKDYKYVESFTVSGSIVEKPFQEIDYIKI